MIQQSEILDAIRTAMLAHKGDDLYRARAAFSRATEQEMDEQWGESGKTRRQVLQEYEHHEAVADAAIDTLKRVGLWR